jgi:hypothetical protein
MGANLCAVNTRSHNVGIAFVPRPKNEPMRRGELADSALRYQGSVDRHHCGGLQLLREGVRHVAVQWHFGEVLIFAEASLRVG